MPIQDCNDFIYLFLNILELTVLKTHENDSHKKKEYKNNNINKSEGHRIVDIGLKLLPFR